MKKTLSLIFFALISGLKAQTPFCLDAAKAFPAGYHPVALANADLNGDGLMDIASVNQDSNNVAVLFGSGAGNFNAPVYYSVGTGPVSIISGDYNGDGKLDIITGNSGSYNISVLLNSGSGIFSAPVNYATSNIGAIISVDVNNDGKMDVVASNGGVSLVSGIQVLLNNGSGTFSAPVNSAPYSRSSYIATDDFNGDGKADIVISMDSSNGSAYLKVYTGDNTGAFVLQNGYLVNFGPTGTASTPVCSDFNSDGKPDVAISNNYISGGGVYMMINNGSGSFATPVISPASPGTWMVSGDFNGDGKTDLAVLDSIAQVSVLMNTGSGTFSAAASYNTDVYGMTLIAGDLNGDGKIDIATSGITSTNVTILFNKGSGTFMSSVYLSMPAQRMVSGDFNGDGLKDIATTDGSTLAVSYTWYGPRKFCGSCHVYRRKLWSRVFFGGLC